jgi:hypothetical protein
MPNFEINAKDNTSSMCANKLQVKHSSFLNIEDLFDPFARTTLILLNYKPKCLPIIMKQFVTLVVEQKCKMSIIPLSRIIVGIITNKQDTYNNKALGYLRQKE